VFREFVYSHLLFLPPSLLPSLPLPKRRPLLPLLLLHIKGPHVLCLFSRKPTQHQDLPVHCRDCRATAALKGGREGGREGWLDGEGASQSLSLPPSHPSCSYLHLLLPGERLPRALLDIEGIQVVHTALGPTPAKHVQLAFVAHLARKGKEGRIMSDMYAIEAPDRVTKANPTSP